MNMDYRKAMALQIKAIAEGIKKQAELLGGHADNMGAFATDNDAENKAHQIYVLADEVVNQMTAIVSKPDESDINSSNTHK